MAANRVGRPRQTSREELRDHARRLFVERGYDQTSLTDIARSVGISRTTLFAYFPAKRDLIWEEFEEHERELRAYLAAHPSGSVVQTLARAMLVVARYSRSEHEDFAVRFRIVEGSEELRAYSALRTKELAATLVGFAAQHSGDADPALIGDFTHALMAVAARATEDWARDPVAVQDLDTFVAGRLGPFVAALEGILSRHVDTGTVIGGPGSSFE